MCKRAICPPNVFIPTAAVPLSLDRLFITFIAYFHAVDVNNSLLVECYTSSVVWTVSIVSSITVGGTLNTSLLTRVVSTI